jgi:hypothetical protein
MSEITQKPNIIPNFINVAEVARRMGKKKEWAYQRLNGWNVNGKPATFKPEEEALIRGVVTDMLIEFCEAIGIYNSDAREFVDRVMKEQGESPEIACIRRLVDAFSFDKGEEDMPEQIAALNEAQMILNPATPSNCKEVAMPTTTDQ